MTDSELPERPPIASAPLSVLLTVSGPAELPATARRWLDFLGGLGREYELLLVDDGSDEAGAAELIRLTKELPALRLVRRTGSPGAGAALRAGVEAARHPLLYTAPAAPEYAPEELKKFLAAIDAVDVVAGCRTGRPTPPFLRRAGLVYRAAVYVFLGVPLTPTVGWRGWQGWLYGALVYAVFGGGLTDVDCPCRLYRRSVFQRIPVQSDGPFALAEVVAKATFQGCYLDEVELPQPAVWQTGSARQRWAEGWRVFQRPNFGPAVLEIEKPEPKKTKRGKRRSRNK
jgi:dolichol-phosphate mannosyltransferase